MLRSNLKSKQSQCVNKPESNAQIKQKGEQRKDNQCPLNTQLSLFALKLFWTSY